MQVKNNYNECLTNFACSIRKYFGLEYKHNTLPYVDELLDSKKPTNVVVILFDGMGSRILDRSLAKNDFFIRNRYKEITTVFPATTTAATTSVATGLNPVEHGWLGWNTYIKPIDKTITLFRNTEKGQEKECQEFIDIKESILENKTIFDEINNKKDARAITLYPFKETKYASLDEMLDLILKETKDTGKKLIYAYDDEPDHTMHDFGPDSSEARDLIFERNIKVENMCKSLKDTIVFVVADHGHIKVEHIFLNDYPEILDMLERTTSLEQRAISFKIKNNKKEEFVTLFNKLFGDFFTLYSKDDIINSQLFGNGEENSNFRDAIGDFIAIANANKCLITDGDTVLTSQHAGYTDDEIYIPLIIIDNTK